MTAEEALTRSCGFSVQEQLDEVDNRKAAEVEEVLLDDGREIEQWHPKLCGENAVRVFRDMARNSLLVPDAALERDIRQQLGLPKT